MYSGDEIYGDEITSGPATDDPTRLPETLPLAVTPATAETILEAPAIHDPRLVAERRT